MEGNNKYKYANIWLRAGAFVIDWLIAMILATIIAVFITFLSLKVFLISTTYFVMQQYPIVIGTYVSIIVFTLYGALMDSSRRQATLGKIVFKIQTVDVNQKRLSFWKALLKYIIIWPIPIFLAGKFVLVAIFIMAIPIAFTSKKQGVYDLIAGCLVLKKDVVGEIISNHDAVQDEPDVTQEGFIEDTQ